MADELMTLDDMAGGKLDFNTLKVFANGDENTVNYPRLLPNVDVGSLAELRKKALEKIPVNATSFKTKADLTANKTLADNAFAFVHDDLIAENNGLYQKAAGAWVYQKWNVKLSNESVLLTHLSTKLLGRIKNRAEWYSVNNTINIKYNTTTKTLSWDGSLLAAWNEYKNGTTRISLSSGSITFAGTGFEMLYLDTDLVGSDGNATTAMLKIGTYSVNGWLDRPNQIPIAKLGKDGICRPASGFLPIDNGTSPVIKDTFYFNKKATTSYIYLPTSSGKLVRVKLYRQQKSFDGTSPDSQSDAWRFADVYETDASYTAQRYIVSNGEWDTAIQVQGATDHVGGVHGDELQTDAYFLIDGIYYAQDAVISTDAKEVTIIQKSNIYLQNTQTVLAERTKVSTINKNGIRTTQKLVFKQAAVLDKAWVTMLPIKRTVNDDGTGGNITDTGVRSSNNYAVEDIAASGFAHVYNNTKAGDTFVISGKTSGISAKVTMQTLDVPSSQNYIANASLYNKLYISAISLTNTYTTSINETWQIVTDIAFNIR